MTKILITLLSSVLLLSNAFGFSHNFDVRTKSNITALELDVKFKNELRGCGKYFIECQRKYGINAEFLAAIAIHESANGSSKIAKTKKNFFGMRGKNGYLSFSTKKECIECAAKNLTKKNGYYFGRGRYTIGSIGKKYAADKKWSTRVAKTMRSIR